MKKKTHEINAIKIPKQLLYDALDGITGNSNNDLRCNFHTAVSYTHLRAHETDSYLVCRLLLEKKKNNKNIKKC